MERRCEKERMKVVSERMCMVEVEKEVRHVVLTRTEVYT